LRISDIFRKLNRFETHAIEQLGQLAASDAKMVVCGTLSATTPLTVTKSPSASDMEIEIETEDTSCTNDTQPLHLKRALCLLMTLA